MLYLRTIFCAFFVLAFVVSAQAQRPGKKSKVKKDQAKRGALLKNNLDSVSYAIGLDMMKNLKEQGLELNIDAVYAALKDSKAGTPKFSEEQKTQVIVSLQQQMQKAQQDKSSAMSDINKKKGEEFLKANKSKKGVKVTASGLQYLMVKEGKGDFPSPTSTVKVHYEGKLLDGSTFDSSYKRGQPATFGLNQVIKGWTEALQLMKPGGVMQVYIPAELAYGASGAGQSIGPNETLIFDIELIEIVK